MKLYSKFTILVFILSFSTFVFAQKSINHYKYVIVPDSYDFAEGKDRYQLNSLTKFLFNKYGFTAYLSTDSLPEDLFSNRCLALYADAEKLKGSLFKTEIKVSLKDCYGQQIHETPIGSTREKSFDKAYSQAIRKSMESLEFLNYTYQPLVKQAESKANVKVTPEKPENSVNSKEELNQTNQPITIADNSKNDHQSKPSEILEKVTYYAQATADGYRIIDDEPKLIMVLLRTAKENTFNVKDKNAIVYLEDGFWYFSQISEGKTIKKVLNLKFYD